jgi:hypothetical protein
LHISNWRSLGMFRPVIPCDINTYRILMT